MPQALLDKLPAKAKEIYEAAYATAKKEYDEARAAQIAIGAVKNAGYKKSETTGMWVKMSESAIQYLVYMFGESDQGWVEVGATGQYTDMHGHRVGVTDANLGRWIQAFEGDERGQELPITIDHPKSGGVAAGWFRGLKTARRKVQGRDATVLLMKPEWTPVGEKSVADKEYQYLSLEIMPEGILRGASLVNFPAVKGLKPVNQPLYFSEFIENVPSLEEPMPDQEGKMKKCPACGANVPEDADVCPACGVKLTEEPMPEKPVEKKELEELQAQVATLQEELAQYAVLSEQLAQLPALQEKVTALAEVESKNKLLSDQVSQQGEQIGILVDLNNMLRLHEKVSQFMQLGESNKRIAPAYEEKIIQFLLSAPDSEDDVLQLLEDVATGKAVVEMGERGTSSIPASSNGSDPTRSKLNERVLKLAEAEKISYRDALIRISEEAAK